MGDSERFNIDIVTTADAAGANQIITSLDEVKTAATDATPAVEKLAEAEERLATAGQRKGPSSLATAPPDLDAPEAAAAEKLTAAEERRNSLIQQRQAIIASETEMMELQAAGRAEEAAALQLEIAEMKEALALQTGGQFTEAEAFAMAKDRVALRERETLELEAQAKLNAELVAEEEARLAVIKAQAIAEAAVAEEKAAQMDMLNRVERGVGRAAGLERNTGLAAAFGPEALAGIIAIQLAIDGVRGVMHALAKEAKDVADANKAAAESAKEMTAEIKKGLSEAKAEAEAYLTALSEIDEAGKKGQARYDKELELGFRNKLAARDEKEIDDLAKAPDEPARARVREEAEKDRAKIKADHEIDKADKKVDAEEKAVKEAKEMKARAESALPAADKDMVDKSLQASASKERAEQAAKHKIEAEKKVHDDMGYGSTATPLDLLNDKAEAASAARQAKSKEELAEKDRVAFEASRSRANELAKAIEDLGQKAKEGTANIKMLTEERDTIAREAAIRLAKEQASAHSQVVTADKTAAEKSEQEKERLLAANKEGAKEESHLDKVEGAVAKGAEKGVESGMAKHGAHHGAHHAAGQHHDGHAHPKDGLGNHDDKHVNFLDAFAKGHLPKAGDKDFHDRFDPSKQPRLDLRTDADKRGAGNQAASEIEKHAATAEAAIKAAQEDTKHPMDEAHKQMAAVIEKLIAALKTTKTKDASSPELKALKTQLDKLDDAVNQIRDRQNNS